MNTYTIEDIRSLRPCYDPTRYLPEGWTGTLLDILAVEDCPAEDRLWVVIGLLDDSTRRLLVCQLVRRTPLADGRTVWDLLTDERSRNVVEVAERFANGEATAVELDAAWVAARDATWDVSRAAAKAASRAAAWAAARNTAEARAAAWHAVRDASWAAAQDAVWDAQIRIASEYLAA